MPKFDADVAQPDPVEGHGISKFLQKLSGQPSSYVRKSNYQFGKTLGAGTFGVVRECRNLITGEKIAMKIILKKTLKGNFQMVYDELKLLQKVSHPNIVGFKDWFESKDKFFIATQLATGGELFDRIVNKGKFTESDAASCIKQILNAISYLHDRDIVHRDVKPENVLYLKSEEEDPKSPIVLADFGIARQLRSKDQILKSSAGSFGYAAPEVIVGVGHGKPCDIWSIGVITYTLLCGYSPFRSENINDFLLEVKNDNGVIFHDKYWKDISEGAKRFILKMLRVDQNKRLTAKELLEDEWITANDNTKVDLLPTIREGFNAKSKFIQAIEMVRLKNRINALRETIEANKKENNTEDDGSSDLEDLEVFEDDNFSFTDNGKEEDLSLKTSSLSLNSNNSNQVSPKKSDLTLKTLQSLVITAHKNKDRVKTFEEDNNTLTEKNQ